MSMSSTPLTSRWVRAGTYGTQLRAKMLHRCLAFAVQLVHVDTTDLAITLVQRQEPGPAPSLGSHLRVRDAVHVDIRCLALKPDGEGCSAPRVAGRGVELQDVVHSLSEVVCSSLLTCTAGRPPMACACSRHVLHWTATMYCAAQA